MMVSPSSQRLGEGAYGQVDLVRYLGFVASGAQRGGQPVADEPGGRPFLQPQPLQPLAVKRLLPLGDLTPNQQFDQLTSAARREAGNAHRAASPFTIKVFGWGFLVRGSQALQLLPPSVAAPPDGNSSRLLFNRELQQWRDRVMGADFEVVIVTEYLPDGSLEDLLARLPGGRMSPLQAQLFSHQLSRGGQYLHQANCVHQ